jgi:hypothetical protein
METAMAEKEVTPPEGYELGQKTLAEFEHLRITDTTPIPIPEPVLILSGETIAVECDIFTISGASKSGKSALAGMCIAASLTDSGTADDGILGLKMKPNPDGHAVIHADTEQARHKHQYNVRTILKRTGHQHCPPYFLSYNIRQLPLAEYAETTAAICEAAAREFSAIHSIWIDGGADYIAGVNDEATANEAIKFFEELAIEYNTAVFIIVHTNPGGDKERGHFGSQCQRKSGGILSVKSESNELGDSSYIEPKMLRYAGRADIPTHTFTFDKEKGYHVGLGIKTDVDTDAIKRKRSLNKAFELMEVIFGGQRSYSYPDALEELARKTFKSERTVKDIFKIMKLQKMILKGEDGNWRKNDKYIHNEQA